MKIRWKEIPLLYRALSILLILFIVLAITFQAVSIHKMKEAQREQFRIHIASAVQSFGEYKETGYAFLYEDAFMELHSASSIALLVKDDDVYEGVHGVLLSIIGAYHSFPEELVPFTDEITDTLKNFSVHQNVENLYTKLTMIDNRLTVILAERLEKVE